VNLVPKTLIASLKRRKRQFKGHQSRNLALKAFVAKEWQLLIITTAPMQGTKKDLFLGTSHRSFKTRRQRSLL